MKLRPEDHKWLIRNYPDLLHDAEANVLVGEIGFCAAYDASIGKLRIGDDADRESPLYLCDYFSVRIELDNIDPRGWPNVFESGGRRLEIAERIGVDVIDLHFYGDDSCCLGLLYYPEQHLTIDRFMIELVAPFFYRLSYAGKHGIEAARSDLWGEYSHGGMGVLEHRTELGWIASQRPGRNSACPCGSGIKYKRCHLDEVEAFMRDLSQPPGSQHSVVSD